MGAPPAPRPPLATAADAKIGRCNACIASLVLSGACAAAFGPLSGAGAPQGLLIPLAVLWGSATIAVRDWEASCLFFAVQGLRLIFSVSHAQCSFFFASRWLSDEAI